MAFITCGLNHNTAPLDIREKLTMAMRMNSGLLYHLLSTGVAREGIALFTCNRAEIFCQVDSPENFIPTLASILQMSQSDLLPYIYLFQDTKAIQHLLRVACGLDSMMLGEPQILGQLKKAYEEAQNRGTAQKNIHQIFQYIFSAAKRIRTKSGIGKNPVSVAYVAAQLIVKSFKELQNCKILIIGSGETASLVAKYLHCQGAKQFIIANRTQHHALQLATQFNGQAITITEIPQYLSQADVVVSATACPLPFINKALIEQALIARNNAPMFLLDLAIPRDIEQDVAEFPAITLYNIDDLHTIIGESLEERKIAARYAEQLIENEMTQFEIFQRKTAADNVINDYRNYMQQLASQELERAQQQLHTGKCQHHVLNEFSNRLMNKLMHLPTLGLREIANDGRQELFDLMNYLLTLNLPEESSL